MSYLFINYFIDILSHFKKWANPGPFYCLWFILGLFMQTSLQI